VRAYELKDAIEWRERERLHSPKRQAIESMLLFSNPVTGVLSLHHKLCYCCSGRSQASLHHKLCYYWTDFEGMGSNAIYLKQHQFHECFECKLDAEDDGRGQAGC
jgi:hypothetical protein